jgi:hypothetical protein
VLAYLLPFTAFLIVAGAKLLTAYTAIKATAAVMAYFFKSVICFYSVVLLVVPFGVCANNYPKKHP